MVECGFTWIRQQGESLMQLPAIPVSSFILAPIIIVAPERHGFCCGLSRCLGQHSPLAHWADKPHHGLAHGRYEPFPVNRHRRGVAFLASQRFGDREQAHRQG